MLRPFDMHDLERAKTRNLYRTGLVETREQRTLESTRGLDGLYDVDAGSSHRVLE